MMELLVSHGADVNAPWHGHFPIIFAPCESWDPAALERLLDHGANPNRRDPRQSAAGHPYPCTALDYLVASYARSPERPSACIADATFNIEHEDAAIAAIVLQRASSAPRPSPARSGARSRSGSPRSA